MKKRLVLMMALIFLLPSCKNISDGDILPPNTQDTEDSQVLPIENNPVCKFDEIDRFYSTPMVHLVANAEYGHIWPYALTPSSFGFFDEKGRIICEPIYDSVSLIGGESGVYCAQKSAPKAPDVILAAWNGSWVMQAEDIYQNADYDASNRLISIKRGGKWGVINFAGETVFPFEYDHPLVFREGYAKKILSDKTRYMWIDLAGREVFGPFDFTLYQPGHMDISEEEAMREFVSVGGFSNSHTTVQKDGRELVLFSDGSLQSYEEYIAELPALSARKLTFDDSVTCVLDQSGITYQIHGRELFFQDAVDTDYQQDRIILIYSNLGRSWSLVDAEGRVLLERQEGEGKFAGNRIVAHGILAKLYGADGHEIPLPGIYTKIRAVASDASVFICNNSENATAIDADGEILVDPIDEEIFNCVAVQLRTGNTMLLYGEKGTLLLSFLV